MPGKTGTVSATYNAAAMGPFNKSVTVMSNGETPNIVLYLKGEVVSKEEAEKAAAAGAKKGTK